MIFASSAELAFDIHEIEVCDADVELLFIGRLTGGEVDDLVVFNRTEQTRHVAVCSHEGETFFSKIISAKVQPDVVFVGIWEFDGGAVSQHGHSRGVDRFNLTTGAFEPWLHIVESDAVQTQSTQQSSANASTSFNFSRDLNGDSVVDIVTYQMDEITSFIHIDCHFEYL